MRVLNKTLTEGESLLVAVIVAHLYSIDYFRQAHYTCAYEL